MSEMPFSVGVSIPNNWGVAEPASLVDLAVLAEQARFSSIWVSEHIFNISYVEKRIGDRPYYHPLALLAFVAARTHRITLGTSVLVAPFHHPAELAKFATTLDGLAPGRLILGLGTGAVADEFAALGVAFEDRGHTTNESLEVMRSLFAAGRSSHKGERWAFEDIIFSPKPTSPGSIPLWVGGGNAKPVYRRAALLGDGWHATGLDRAEFGAGVAAVRELAAEAGRPLEDFTFSMRVNVDYGEPLPSPAEEKTRIASGNPRQMAEELRAWRASGAEHVILALNVSAFSQLHEEIQRIGEDVVPLLA